MFRVYMRFYGKISPDIEATTVFGSRIFCRRADFIQRRIAFFGLFEPNLTYFLLDRLRPGDVFIDVGANIGYFTLLAAGRVGPQGKVYAIEASPETFALLQRNIALNGFGNIEAINKAVTDRACRVQIRSVDARNIGANRIELSEDGIVEGAALPDIVGADLDRAHVIKIDVEGAEDRILPDLFRRMQAHKTGTMLISEISDDNRDLMQQARECDLTMKALPNDYSINQLLVRSVLRRSGDGDFWSLRTVNGYINELYNYIFEANAT